MGSLAFTGQAPTVLFGLAIPVPSGSLTLSGLAPNGAVLVPGFNPAWVESNEVVSYFGDTE